MKNVLKRGLLGIGALAVPAGALMALPMAATHAAPLPAIQVVTDCNKATAAAPQGYPNGCHFDFYDGNRQAHTFTNYLYGDVVTPTGNETEVFTGITANSQVANNTGKFVTYNSMNNPSHPGQTALSFVSGKTTTNWTMTIAPNGMWILTANFS